MKAGFDCDCTGDACGFDGGTVVMVSCTAVAKIHEHQPDWRFRTSTGNCVELPSGKWLQCSA